MREPHFSAMDRLVSEAMVDADDRGEEDVKRLVALILAALVASNSDVPSVQSAADQFLATVRLGHDEHALLAERHARMTQRFAEEGRRFWASLEKETSP